MCWADNSPLTIISPFPSVCNYYYKLQSYLYFVASITRSAAAYTYLYMVVNIEGTITKKTIPPFLITPTLMNTIIINTYYYERIRPSVRRYWHSIINPPPTPNNCSTVTHAQTDIKHKHTRHTYFMQYKELNIYIIRIHMWDAIKHTYTQSLYTCFINPTTKKS